MALSIPLRRGFALGSRGAPGAPKIQFPLNSGQTGYPGYIVTLDTGRGNLTKAASSGLIGLLESRHSNSAEDEIAVVSLFIPGTWWEFSLNGTSASVSNRGRLVAFEAPSSGEFATVGDSTSTGFRIVHFASDQGKYLTDNYIDEYGNTSAGNTNTPQADLGGPGDDYPRVVGVPDLSATVLG